MSSFYTEMGARAISPDFIAAIESGRNVACTADGNWHYEWRITSFFRWIFGLRASRDAYVIEIFNRSLADLERKVVVLNPLELGKNAEFKTYIVAAEALIHRFKDQRFVAVSTQVNFLARQIIGLKYRCEEGNEGGLAKVPPVLNSENVAWNELVDQAKAWRGEHIKFSHPRKKELTKGALNRLGQAMHYPEFMELLKKDPVLREEFFEWTIIYRNDVCVFVEFPATQKRLREAQMGPRTGAYFGHCLKAIIRTQFEEGEKELKERMEQVKDVTLEFDTLGGARRLSILDENLAVTFANSVTHVIGYVLDAFEKKGDWGEFEVFNGKVHSWRAKEIGAKRAVENFEFEQVDLEAPEWWKALPPMRTLSIFQAQRWYGEHCDGINFGAKIMATREFNDLRAEGTHSYLEVVAPVTNSQGEIVYHLYSFAKYPKKLPSTTLEYFKTVAGTSEACIVYPDQSVQKRYREHDGVSLELVTPELGINLMNAIKRDIRAGRENNLAYQLFTDNCGMWTCSVASVVFPEKAQEYEQLFATSFMHARPLGIAGRIFSVVKKMPVKFQEFFLNIFFVPFGSTIAKNVQDHQGKVRRVSLWSQPVWGAGKSAKIPAAWFWNRDRINFSRTM